MSDLQIENLSRRFGETVALDSTSIDVPSGSFLALLGPSGCGKTTTLRIVAGFESADSGDVRVNGTSILSLPPNKRHLGMMFQDYSLFPHMTVAENVGFGLKMAKVSRAETDTRVREALELVRLPQVADRYPSQLSGGQKQRIALARSMVVNPSVLLLDEPLAALDKNLRESMQFELKRLQMMLGITTVMVTHDQEEALTLADQVAVMDRGKIMQRGAPREIYDSPSNRFVAEFLGTANLFQGEYVVRDGRAAITLPGHGEPATFITVPATATASGPQVIVGVRPEKISLSVEEPATENRMRCRVVGSAFRGAVNAYELTHPAVSGHIIVYQTPKDMNSGLPLKIDQNAWISWDAGNSFAFAS